MPSDDTIGEGDDRYSDNLTDDIDRKLGVGQIDNNVQSWHHSEYGDGGDIIADNAQWWDNWGMTSCRKNDDDNSY